MSVDSAVADSRSVATAAAALLRSVRGQGADVQTAVDHLELQARRTIESSVQGFDAADIDVSEEDVLAEALSQIGIGVTLVTAESALEQPQTVDQLDRAVTSLEANATTLESGGAVEAATHGFDTAPDGVLLSVDDAAIQSLDEMSATAADVASTLLDKARKPLMTSVPEPLRNPVTAHADQIAGRLLRWGLRAVARGLDLLLNLVDLAAIERARNKLERILAGLDQGDEPHVLMAFAIGAQEVRDRLAPPAGDSRSSVDDARRRTVEDLAALADRFARLCVVLRRVAAAIVGLAGALAMVQITLPHATAISIVGLCLVLGAVVVLGRDYTGATDLPGRVRGVRFLVGGA